MINIEDIVTAFEDSVRFNQTENPDEPLLDSSLVEPLTARLAYHPILTNENLSAIAPNYDTMNWPTWIVGNFTEGKTVAYDGTYWTASENTISTDVPGVSPKWLERGKLSKYLIERRKEAIRTAIMDIYNTKKESHIARETLGDLMLYDGAGNLNDLIVNKSQLVGLEIKLLENTGLEVILKQISLQLSAAQDMVLYLWHSSSKEAIATINLSYTKNYSVQWFDLDRTLKYRDLSNNLDNGLYYLGYYQDDIAVQAVRKRFNFGSIPCGTCSQYNRKAYQRYSQYVKVRAFRIASPPANNELWDIDNTVYETDNNWGLNLRLQPNCNITQYIIDKKEVFADVISWQLKYNLLAEVANTTRSNSISEQTKTLARGVLQSEHLGGEGISSNLKKSKSAASLEISDIERNVCMPRAKPKGVTTNNIRIRGRSY